MLSAFLLIVTLVCLGSAGCSARSPSTAHPYGMSSPSWFSCPQRGETNVECARLRVPMDWQNPEGPQTTILLRRVPPSGPVRAQLWALDGGPGFAGDTFLEPGFLALLKDTGVELYVPSHRGTRDESSLLCPDLFQDTTPPRAEAWRACRDHLETTWGSSYEEFRVRPAAADVTYAMSLTSEKPLRLVFGGSYGTLWAQHVLVAADRGQHPSDEQGDEQGDAPDREGTPHTARIDGVWLDSIVAYDGTLERVDEHADAAFATLLHACAEHDACAARFAAAGVAADPNAIESAVRSAFLAYGSGRGCGQSDGIERAALQKLFARWLMGAPQHWVLGTAAAAQLVRCEQEDVESLSRALARAAAPASSDDPSAALAYRPELNRTMLYRELYLFDRTDEERRTFEGSALALHGNAKAIADEAEVFGADFRNEPPAFLQPGPGVPVFALSGALDPLDPPPWAERLTRDFPNVNLVAVPWAGHSVLRYLGLNRGECGWTLFRSFLDGRNPDGTCAKAAPPPDFSGASDTVRDAAVQWFGAPLE